MKTIERSSYLDWLVRWKDKQIIKVVSGVRRCGKSTMFDIFRDYLLKNGVESRQLIMINFEDVKYEHFTEYKLLYEHVNSLLQPDMMNYIFLDEIQHVEQFEKVVDSLFLNDKCDVYITGSNAYFMSGELATLLSGRYVELKMLPLSFKEFCSGLESQNRKLSKTDQFNLYLETGSFPFTLKFELDAKDSQEYLQDIYSTVLLKDIVARLKISDVTSLENVTKFLLHNIGNKVSPTRIANTLKSAGKSVDQKTVDRYIRGLTDSLILYEASRYNIKGRQYLSTQSKYYVVDVALRNMLVKGQESDIGHILENIVYLELLRRGFDVYVGQLKDSEVDFVAVCADETFYYQVAATTLDEQTLMRELAPLKMINDNHPKTLLTLDEIMPTANYEGIQKQNAIDWLLTE